MRTYRELMTCESQPPPARERSAALSAIALAHAEPIAPAVRFALGAERLDATLGGGLARARLHELWPAAAEDAPAAAGFALMLASRAAGENATIIWIGQEHPRHGTLYPPGLS